MIHFFPRYTNDVTDDPFAVELRRLGVEHRLFATWVNRRYRTKIELLLSVYPRLAWISLRDAVHSLLLSRPRPDVAVVGNDVEALIFGLVRVVTRVRSRIVMQTLIITPRSSALANRLYEAYYGLILALIDGAICHSRAEVSAYPIQFPSARCRFAFIPYGLTVTDATTLMAESQLSDNIGDIVTAGRSSRDYATLAAAIVGLPCKLRIICDVAETVASIPESDQINVLRDCFDRDYLRELAFGRFIVVPLSSNDQSSGQMVFLQASGLGKATILTRTRTTVDYGEDGKDVLFVPMGDVAQMRAAIQRLLEDEPLRLRLGANARKRFEREYSTEAYVRNLVKTLEEMGCS